MNNYLIVLKALFRNKLRFDEGKSKRKKFAFIALIALAYLLVMIMFISFIVELKYTFILNPQFALTFYFFILFTTALIVLFFGIVHLISVLYLSKDTDFYSMLPIKPVTVFAAKLSYVYLVETTVAVAIAMPLLIAFGIVSQMWGWFYVIALPTLLIVPALPLVLSAVIAVPVMLIASKLKNRNIIALIFYLLLFGICFGAYIYFIYLSSSSNTTPEEMAVKLKAIEALYNVLFPYTVLASTACGVPMYGLNVGASTVVGLAIFLGISIVVIVMICILAKFMYAQAVKANNQTDNSKAKKSEFKTSTGMRALIKREYLSSLLTTQIAFQCYAVMLLPIIMAVIFGILSNGIMGASTNANVPDGIPSYFGRYFVLIGFCTLAAMFATLGNAASTTFSREGKAMASLKTLPVSATTVLKSKVTAWLALAVPVAIVAVTVFNAMNFEWRDYLLSLFSLVPLAILFVMFGALWDLSAPKLNWTDPIQAVKHNMHVLGGQMIMMASGFISLIVMFALNSAGVGFDGMYIVCWTLLYAAVVGFAVADVLMYKKVNVYYNRLEI